MTKTGPLTNSVMEMAVREEDLKAGMLLALDGDATAYAALLRQLVPILRAFFWRRVRDSDAIEDLVQDTLMAIHSRRASFDRQRPFTAWLFAIARYKIADHYRRARISSVSDEIDGQEPANDFELEASARIDVGRLLSTLTPKQRDAIHATRIEGRSLEETAQAAGISQSDAKMSVYRGLRRLSASVQGKVP